VFHNGRGCLAVIAAIKPRNLTIIRDDGLSRITGKPETATATDIVAVARGAGLAASERCAATRIAGRGPAEVGRFTGSSRVINAILTIIKRDGGRGDDTTPVNDHGRLALASPRFRSGSTICGI